MLLAGRVTQGFGVATNNLASVAALICERTGLGSVYPGTLNLRLKTPYFVESTIEISAAEYHGWERLLLQRCCLGGTRGVIVRPETHHTGNGHGAAYLEIVSEVHLRTVLAIKDGDTLVITTGDRLACWRDMGRPEGSNQIR